MDGQASVLICEDEALTALRLGARLLELGYRTAGKVKDGVAAVEAAIRLRPDLILMDVRMPKMDGIEATRRIMLTQPTPIVIISAFSERDLVTAALDAGASGYLVKPVSDEQLEPAISMALRQFAALRELQTEVAGLEEALQARKVTERAKGVLMRRLQLSEEEAHRKLQSLAREHRTSVAEIAVQILQESMRKP